MGCQEKDIEQEATRETEGDERMVQETPTFPYRLPIREAMPKAKRSLRLLRNHRKYARNATISG